MMLVKCPACEADVSPRAASCPRCGDPLVLDAVARHPRVQTVEATGKGWKAVQLVGVLAILAGVVVLVAGGPSGGPLSLGLLAYVAGRVGAWWNHG